MEVGGAEVEGGVATDTRLHIAQNSRLRSEKISLPAPLSHQQRWVVGKTPPSPAGGGVIW